MTFPYWNQLIGIIFCGKGYITKLWSIQWDLVNVHLEGNGRSTYSETSLVHPCLSGIFHMKFDEIRYLIRKKKGTYALTRKYMISRYVLSRCSMHVVQWWWHWDCHYRVTSGITVQVGTPWKGDNNDNTWRGKCNLLGILTSSVTPLLGCENHD